MRTSLKAIFTVSLLLNIALVGVVGGHVWKRWLPPEPLRETSEETRAIFKAAFDEGRENMHSDIEEMRAIRPALEEIIIAETFDRAAYNSQIKKVLAIKEDMSARKSSILGDVLEKLPHDERQKIAPKLLSKLTEDRHYSRGGHHHGRVPRPPRETQTSE